MTRESLENVSSLSRAQLETVAEIVLAGGVFSMLGCVVIIAVFLHASHLRTSFAFQLVFGLSIAEFGNATWPMFFMPDGDTAACTTQALTLQFFSFASVLWTCAIAYTLSNARKNGGAVGASLMMSSEQRTNRPFDVRRFHAVIWSVSGALATVPWSAGVLGPAGAWCWIDARRGRTAQAFRLMCFYVPVWCVIAYEVRVYAALYKQLSAMTRLASATATMREDARREAAARGGGGDMEDSGSDDDDDEETGGPRGDDDAATAATLRRLLRRLGAYPVILICAWFFPTLNRVVNMFKGGDTTGDVYALYVLQAIGMSTQGVGNVIAYGMSAAVRKHVAETMARACGGGLGSGGDARAGLKSVRRELELGNRGSGGGGGGSGGSGGGGDGGAERVASPGREEGGNESLLEIDLSEE
jgi:hypothetical protein